MIRAYHCPVGFMTNNLRNNFAGTANQCRLRRAKIAVGARLHKIAFAGNQGPTSQGWGWLSLKRSQSTGSKRT